MPYVTLQEASEIVFREAGIDITVPQLIRLGATINLPLCVLLNLRCYSPTHRVRRRKEAEERDPDYWSKAHSNDDLGLADAYGLFVLPPRHVFDFQTEETVRIDYVTSLDGKDNYFPGVDRSRSDLQITMLHLSQLITHIEASKSQGLSVPDTSGAPEKAALPAGASTSKPIPRQRFQEQEILRVIRELGHDPRALPRDIAGKPGVKADVRNRLTSFSPSVFKHAWERLSDSQEIIKQK